MYRYETVVVIITQISCSVPMVVKPLYDVVRCDEEDIRLIDGRTGLEGRVEICWNGFWRSVCDDKWSYREAQVVCRELGYIGSRLTDFHVVRSVSY